MRYRTRTGLVAVAAGTALVLLAPFADAAPAPGAPGVGDPYYPGAGNGGYDVGHYDIRLTYQPATDLLSGTTTILATTTQELSRFNLDFGLKVNSVRVDNVSAAFAPDPADHSELVVTPPAPLPAGRPITVVVGYADTPSTVVIDGFTSWVHTHDGALAVQEPQSAEWWFPSNDHPTDKATFDISVEVPDSVQALSGGVLVSRTKNRTGWTRWNWRSTAPQATYLATLEVGDFQLEQSTTAAGRPFITAYGTDLGDSLGAARASVQRTPEIDEFLESEFGPFPFEAQGGVVSTGLNFALEAQTRPVYSAKFFRAGANTTVIAHENAHQWFGDSVSVGRWSDIWLNEGFASYAEYLWSEHQGEGTAAELAQFTYDSHGPGDALWTVLPGDPGADKQFDAAVYDRGALTLQALRHAVGDDTFFRILRAWAAQRAGGNGTIPQFEAVAEQVSGQPLRELFQTWLFTLGKPAVGPNGPAPAALARQVGSAPRSYAQIQDTHRLLAQQAAGR
jgi:aminopeptidase N